MVTNGVEFMKVSCEEDVPVIAHLSFPWRRQTYAPAEDEIEIPPNRRWDMARKAPHLIGTIQMVVDHAGKGLDFLDDVGIEDDTIVVYSADHSDCAREHGTWIN